MRFAPRFWWRPDATLPALLLSPLAALWGLLASRRMRRAPGWRAPVPVICVGNFTVGGAGKTPTALALAQMLRAEGISPGFVIRGYGGTARGPVLVDPGRHRAAEVGDEALLLAAAGPTVVSGDRAAGGRLLVGTGVGAIVMDDGFQNPGLAKDFCLVLVDAAMGVGNGRMVPAGPLRAPLALQIAAADAVLAVGDGTAADSVVAVASAAGRPVLRARMVAAGAGWEGRRVLAFAGIGRPEKFFASLAGAGAVVVASRAFPDHHRFTEAEAESLLDAGRRDGLQLATTEKDQARLRGEAGRRAALAAAAATFPVAVAFEDPAAMRALLRRALGRA